MQTNNTSNQVGNQNIQFNKNKPPPEIRNIPNSRKNEEPDQQGR